MTSLTLGPLAAQTCPVRTAIDATDPSSPDPGEIQADDSPVALPVPGLVVQDIPGLPDRDELRDRVYRAVTTAMAADCVLVTGPDRVAQTIAAMDAGVRVILDGELPADLEGHRTSAPELLVRVDGGYLPGVVRPGATLDEADDTIRISTLVRPWEPMLRHGMRALHRSVDLFELAHHTRALEACDRHAGPYLGFVIGTSQHDGAEGSWPVFVWSDLTRTSGRDLVRVPGALDDSVLAQYDREHAARVEVARAAQEGDGIDTVAFPALDAAPVWQDECVRCTHTEECRDRLGPDDASLALGSDHLDIHEWAALHRRGVRTVADVAAIDLDDVDFVADYVAEVVPTPIERAEKALALIVARARMLRDGQRLQRRHQGPLHVPSADVEIDTDVEWDGHGRVFMWGARLRRNQDESVVERHDEFCTTGPLDDESERALARAYVTWLTEVVQTEREAGRSVAVYHWSHLEIAHLRRILGNRTVARLVGSDGVYVDLRAFVEREFLLSDGAGLPAIAEALGLEAPRPTVLGDDAAPSGCTTCSTSAAVRDELRRRFAEG